MVKNDKYAALTPEVAKGLQISINGFFEQWKAMLIESMKAVDSFNATLETFIQQDREELAALHIWENEGGAACDRGRICAGL